MTAASTRHQIPCMYCSEPVGPDGDTDDGENYQCARCRAEFERKRRAVVAGFNAYPSLPTTSGRPPEMLCTLFSMITSGVLAVPAGRIVEVSGL
jgi:hypothetical protein